MEQTERRTDRQTDRQTRDGCFTLAAVLAVRTGPPIKVQTTDVARSQPTKIVDRTDDGDSVHCLWDDMRRGQRDAVEADLKARSHHSSHSN